MTQPLALPELPPRQHMEPQHNRHFVAFVYAYDAEAMRAYALAAQRLAIEEAARVCEEMDLLPIHSRSKAIRALLP